MGKEPLNGQNKVYTFEDLKPKFITGLQNYFRKLKLGWYKKKKVNKSKTPHQRFYHMKFKIHIGDDLNPQVSDLDYEMVVPARAAFFAKAFLERSIKEKMYVDVVDWDEMTDAEIDAYLESKDSFSPGTPDLKIDLSRLPSEQEFDKWIDENVIQLSDGKIKIQKRASITEWIREYSNPTTKD